MNTDQPSQKYQKVRKSKKIQIEKSLRPKIVKEILKAFVHAEDMVEKVFR
jgi:hypothetical protein